MARLAYPKTKGGDVAVVCEPVLCLMADFGVLLLRLGLWIKLQSSGGSGNGVHAYSCARDQTDIQDPERG